MSETYIRIFDHSNEACAFGWLLIIGESTIDGRIDIEFAFFCYDEQNKIAICIVYKQKCSFQWVLYMFISEEWKYNRHRTFKRFTTSTSYKIFGCSNTFSHFNIGENNCLICPLFFNPCMVCERFVTNIDYSSSYLD